MKPLQPAGVVLAAGLSRRMGSPKALLRLGNTTFLDSLLASLLQARLSPLLAVVSSTIADTVRRDCRLDEARLLVNPDPDSAPIDSLRLALGRVPDSPGVVFFLVDQASLEPATVAAVAAALARTPVAVASYRGRPGHPTAFRRDVFARLLGPEANHGADKLVQELRRQGQVLEVDCDDPGVVRNINTRDRLQRFLAGKID